LKTAVEDAKNAMTSLERANSLRMEQEQALSQLQEHLEHSYDSCQATQETVESLEGEVNKLTFEKDNLQQNMKLLRQEKQRLQQSIEELTNDVDQYKKKLSVLTNRNLKSSRDLLHANERVREFANERFRINMKLIWTDAKAMFEKVETSAKVVFEKVGVFRYYSFITGWTFPYFEFVMQVILGIWSDNAALFDDLTVVKEWHKVHVQPILDKFILLIHRNLVELHGKVLEGLAHSIQYQSGSILSYLRSLEGESRSRSALLGAFEYSKSHSDKVAHILERSLCVVATFWLIVGLFAWRRHRSKPLPGAKVMKGQSYVKTKVD
jgi:archaellum component FlaC